jgi:hypothetical protein
MFRLFRSIFAALAILAATVSAPASAPARAGVFPIQLWDGVVLPTQSPFSGTGWVNSGAGWNVPAAHPANGPAITGLVAWMTLGEKFDVPAGHVKYQVLRSSNSCLAIVGATFWESGILRRGLGVWDACVYSGWIYWRWIDSLDVANYEQVVSGLKLIQVKTIKSGANWQAWLWNNSAGAWEQIGFNTAGSGPAVGALHFFYTQSPGSGGCATAHRPHFSNVMAEIIPGGWQNVSDFRGLSSLTGCFSGGGWTRSEGSSWVRANTPNP